MTANEKQEYAVDNTDFRGKIREEFESNILKTLKAAQDGPLKELFEALLLPLVYSPKNNKQRIEVVSQVADLLNKEFNEIPFDPTLMTRNQYFPDLVEEYINMSCNHSVSRKLEVQGVSETLIFGEHNFFADLWGEDRGNIVKEILFRRLEGSGTDWYEPKMELRTYFRTTHCLELYSHILTCLIDHLLYWAAYEKDDLDVMRTWCLHPEYYRGSEENVLCDTIAPWIAVNADKDDKDIIEYCQLVTNDNVASTMMFTALFYSHRQSQWQKACEYLTPKCKKKIIKPLLMGGLNGNKTALAFLIQYILENDLTAIPDIAERISKLPFCYKQCNEDL